MRQGIDPVNPVTSPIVGLRTFDIGPGKPYTFDTVPWGSLVAGDVVNVFWQPTPYVTKFGLRAKGTAEHPVVINGVTSEFGERPVLQFAGAKTAPGSSTVFSGDIRWGESLGGIVIKRGNGEPWEGPKPSHIHIQNLHLKDARGSYTTMANKAGRFSSAGGVYVLAGDDIFIDNCVITNCGFGVFTMAKEGTLAHTIRRITIRDSRIYDNGTPGSWFDHNLYVQADSPVVEGNFIGKVIDGSEGSSYKDRSARTIFRNNTVITSSRALDLVHAEEQEDGTAALPYYGFDYVYGNTIVNDSAYEAIHYGGDNLGEQEDEGEEFVPPVPYRSRLFFWNNDVLHVTPGWRNIAFGLSTRRTVAEVFNNRILFGSDAENHYMVEYAGDVRLGPGNVFTGVVQATGRDGLLNDNISITTGHAIPDDEFLQQLMSQ